MTGKPPAPDAASTETKPEEPKANPADIKKNIAKNRTATGASGFKGSTAAKSPEPEAPEAPINVPEGSTIKTINGDILKFTSEYGNEGDAPVWLKLNPKGTSPAPIENKKQQQKISQAWQKQQNKPVETPKEKEPEEMEGLEFESFKSFFWNF